MSRVSISGRIAVPQPRLQAAGQAECLAGEVMVMCREDRAVTVGAYKALRHG